MHVALIIDAERLGAERAAVMRLAVGLMSEGLRVTCVLPESTAETDVPEMGLARTVTAPMRVLPWARSDRASRLEAALERNPPDVLHAFGQEAWKVGVDLANRLDRPLAIDLARAADIEAVPRGRRSAPVGAYIAPTAPIAEALRGVVEPELVCLVPVGVAIPPQARHVLEKADHEPGLIVVGSGRDISMYRGFLRGLASALRRFSDLHVFIELRGRHQHEIWRLTQELDLGHAISTFANATHQRQLVTECDVLVVPERLGVVRTLILETMAAGVPVIAGDDPWLDMLIHGRTAEIVPDESESAWAGALESILQDPAAARTLGRGGRERIGACHRSTEQIRALAGAYEQMSRGETIPI